MDRARPHGARKPHQLVSGVAESDQLEGLQLEAFEAGVEEWWLIIGEEANPLSRLEGEG